MRTNNFEHNVICQICGYTHEKTIQGHIRWKHPEISIKEYVNTYDAEIISNEFRNAKAESQRLRQTGKKASEETRAKLSKAHTEMWTNEMRKNQSDRMHQKLKDGTHPLKTEEVKEKTRQNAIARNKTEKQKEAVKTALTGVELSKERRKNISEGHKGLITSEETKEKLSNIMLKIRAEGNMPVGCHKRGTYFSTKMNKEVIYRSSYELAYYKILDEDDTIKTWEVECIKIPYLFEGKTHTYFPDLLINGNEIREIKPVNLIKHPKNIAKQEAAEKFCLDRNWKYSYITEEDIF